MSPPAAVSATEIVSLRDLSKLATSSTIALRGSGGNLPAMVLMLEQRSSDEVIGPFQCDSIDVESSNLRKGG